MIERKLRILEQGEAGGKNGRTVNRKASPSGRQPHTWDVPNKSKSRPERGGFPMLRWPLVVFVAGALPGDQLADGRAGARNRLLVGFDFRARGFFADCSDAEADLLFFRIHLDDLKVVLQAGLKMQRLAVFIGSF